MSLDPFGDILGKGDTSGGSSDPFGRMFDQPAWRSSDNASPADQQASHEANLRSTGWTPATPGEDSVAPPPPLINFDDLKKGVGSGIGSVFSGLGTAARGAWDAGSGSLSAIPEQIGGQLEQAKTDPIGAFLGLAVGDPLQVASAPIAALAGAGEASGLLQPDTLNNAFNALAPYAPELGSVFSGRARAGAEAKPISLDDLRGNAVNAADRASAVNIVDQARPEQGPPGPPPPTAPMRDNVQGQPNLLDRRVALRPEDTAIPQPGPSEPVQTGAWNSTLDEQQVAPRPAVVDTTARLGEARPITAEDLVSSDGPTAPTNAPLSADDLFRQKVSDAQANMQPSADLSTRAPISMADLRDQQGLPPELPLGNGDRFTPPGINEGAPLTMDNIQPQADTQAALAQQRSIGGLTARGIETTPVGRGDLGLKGERFTEPVTPLAASDIRARIGADPTLTTESGFQLGPRETAVHDANASLVQAIREATAAPAGKESWAAAEAAITKIKDLGGSLENTNAHLRREGLPELPKELLGPSPRKVAAEALQEQGVLRGRGKPGNSAPSTAPLPDGGRGLLNRLGDAARKANRDDVGGGPLPGDNGRYGTPQEVAASRAREGLWRQTFSETAAQRADRAQALRDSRRAAPTAEARATYMDTVPGEAPKAKVAAESAPTTPARPTPKAGTLASRVAPSNMFDPLTGQPLRATAKFDPATGKPYAGPVQGPIAEPNPAPGRYVSTNGSRPPSAEVPGGISSGGGRRITMKDLAYDTATLPKTLTTIGAPLHAGGRHIMSLALSHPPSWLKGMGSGISTTARFLKNPETARIATDDTIARYRKGLADNSGPQANVPGASPTGLARIEIKNPHGGAASGFDDVPSKQLGRIPIVGRFIEGTQAGFGMTSNTARYEAAMGSLKQYESLLGRQLTEAEKGGIADRINHFTGRGFRTEGDIAKKVATYANVPFFSPQLRTSYIRMAGDVASAALHPKSIESLETMRLAGGTIGAVGVMVGMAKAAGLNVDTDPNSSNFMKIDLGPTGQANGIVAALGSQLGIGVMTSYNGHVYADPTHGLANYIKTIAQTHSNWETGKVDFAGRNQLGTPLLNLAQGHLAPGAYEGAGLLRDQVVKPLDLVTPMTVGGAIDAAGGHMPTAQLASAHVFKGDAPVDWKIGQPAPPKAPTKTPTKSTKTTAPLIRALKTAAPVHR